MLFVELMSDYNNIYQKHSLIEDSMDIHVYEVNEVGEIIKSLWMSIWGTTIEKIVQLKEGESRTCVNSTGRANNDNVLRDKGYLVFSTKGVVIAKIPLVDLEASLLLSNDKTKYIFENLMEEFNEPV